MKKVTTLQGKFNTMGDSLMVRFTNIFLTIKHPIVAFTKYLVKKENEKYNAR